VITIHFQWLSLFLHYSEHWYTNKKKNILASKKPENVMHLFKKYMLYCGHYSKDSIPVQ